MFVRVFHSMLSDKKIRQLIEEGELDITDLNEEDQITPIGVDLTVGPSYKRPATQEVFHAEEKGGQIILQPDTFYHLHTVESVNLPEDLYGRTDVVMERSLEGVQVTTGTVDPGFNGRLLLGVENVSERSKTLTVGDRIVQINIHEVGGVPDETYEGDTHYDRSL